MSPRKERERRRRSRSLRGVTAAPRLGLALPKLPKLWGSGAAHRQIWNYTGLPIIRPPITTVWGDASPGYGRKCWLAASLRGASRRVYSFILITAAAPARLPRIKPNNTPPPNSNYHHRTVEPRMLQDALNFMGVIGAPIRGTPACSSVGTGLIRGGGWGGLNWISPVIRL